MRLALVLLASASFSGCGVGKADPVQVPAAGTSFVCKPYRVWDGDTFGCAGGPTVRVSGIAAREVEWDSAVMRDVGCSSGHPCPATGALAAREALADMLGDRARLASSGHLLVDGPEMSCVSTGSAGGKRIGAFCRSARVGDLSCAMIRGGYAVKWERYWRNHRC